MSDRYISEELWVKEFEPIYNNEEEMEKRIQACSPLHKEMVEFAKTLADKPSNWYLHVWTAIDGDDGTMYLVNGPALCNRIDWYFTKNPYVQDKLITVAFEDQEDFEEDIKR